jgi:Zn-dependent protease
MRQVFLAVFNTLLNLFNMPPVFPLDDSNVQKSVAFSINTKFGLICCALGAIFGIYLSNYLFCFI